MSKTIPTMHAAYLQALLTVLAGQQSIDAAFTIRICDDAEGNTVANELMADYAPDTAIVSGQLVDIVMNGGDATMHAVECADAHLGYVWVWHDFAGQVDRAYAY